MSTCLQSGNKNVKTDNFIGNQVNINLLIVHTFSKKWGVLEKIGVENKNIPAGYLQLDLSIVSSFAPPAPAVLQIQNDDIIEENLMLPDPEDGESQAVKYLINIFEGHFAVKKDYIVQVSFGSNNVNYYLFNAI